MEEETEVKAKQTRTKSESKHGRRFTPEQKLRAVRLHLQEGFSLRLVGEEMGVSITVGSEHFLDFLQFLLLPF